MSIENLFDQLIKTIHDIAVHQDVKDVLADIVISAADVLDVVPGAGGAIPTIVSDVANVVVTTLAGSHNRLKSSMLEGKTDSVRPDRDPNRLNNN